MPHVNRTRVVEEPQPILVERYGDGVAGLILNNPPLNLITRPLTGQLLQATVALEQDDSVRTVVVSGAGDRAFSIGSDLKELPAVRE